MTFFSFVFIGLFLVRCGWEVTCNSVSQH